MLLLPTPADRASLRAFGVFVVIAVGVLATAGLLLVGRAPTLGGSAFVAAGVTVAGVAVVLRPRAVWPAYRGWNWLVRHATRVALRYVTAVCFFTVVVALTWTTPPRRFATAPSDSSMWFARGTQPPEGYRSLAHDLTSVPSGSWTGPLRAWTRSSGHPEARMLLPFLWLLRVLDSEQARTGPAARHIYTLY